METNLLLIPGAAITRAILGWFENAAADGKFEWLEWRKLVETVLRMGVPMVALVWGLDVSPELSAGIVVLGDVVLSKFYSVLKKKK